MVKLHINVTIDKEVYLYHKEKGTAFSSTINDFLKGLMLEEDAIALKEAEEQVKLMKEGLSKSLIALSIAKETALKEQKELEESKATDRELFIKDFLQEFLDGERQYWKDAILILNKLPSKEQDFYNSYCSIYRDDVTIELWRKKLSLCKENQSDI